MEHRQDLQHEMEKICNSYDEYRQYSNEISDGNHFLHLIDQWERKSIRKIRESAQMARGEILNHFQTRKRQIREIIRKNSQQILSHRENDNYTEIELQYLREQLNELQRLVEAKPQIEPMNTDGTLKLLCLISVNFNELVEKLDLPENNSVATCSTSLFEGSSTDGKNTYSSGRHLIRFRIIKIQIDSIFFGIKSAKRKTSQNNFKSTAHYGWSDLVQTKEMLIDYLSTKDREIQTGDELTLILDCDQKQIHLEHHRTLIEQTLHVDLEVCPLPWNSLIMCNFARDSFRILSLE